MDACLVTEHKRLSTYFKWVKFPQGIGGHLNLGGTLGTDKMEPQKLLRNDCSGLLLIVLNKGK